MEISRTLRLYQEDDHCFESGATVLAIREHLIAFDQTCFYPGGGGQPPDEGILNSSSGATIHIESAQVDSNDVIWHVCQTNPPSSLISRQVQLILNKERRLLLMRYHTVLHVLNTMTLRVYGGWITGVQIHTDYSRIDFKLENFSPSVAAELENKGRNNKRFYVRLA